MRILHVAPVPSTNASGFFHSVRGLAEGQRELGNKVALILSGPTRSGGSSLPIGVECIKGEPTINPWKDESQLLERGSAKIGGVDVCVFHGTYLPLHSALAKACRRRRIPYVVTPRGDLMDSAQQVKALKKYVGNIVFAREYVDCASAGHALTKREEAAILKFSPHARVFVVPNGLNADLTVRGPAEPSGPFHVVFIGRLDTYIKGLDLLFDAIDMMQADATVPPVRFTLAGPFYTTRDRDYVQRRWRRLRDRDSVSIPGPLNEEAKIRLLLTANCAVCSSRSEGMPITILEAMALGVPSVVTEGSGMAPLVDDNACGMSATTEGAGIARALRQMSLDREAARAMGLRGRSLAISQLTWPSIAKQHTMALDSVIEHETGAARPRV